MAYRLRSYHRADQMLTRGHCQRQPNNAEYPQVTRRWNMIRSPRAYNIRLSSATLRGREPNSQGIPNSARGPVVNGSSPASPVLQPYSTTLGYAPMSVLVICFSGHIPKKMHWVSFWKKPPATYLPTYCSEVCQTVGTPILDKQTPLLAGRGCCCVSCQESFEAILPNQTWSLLIDELFMSCASS